MCVYKTISMSFQSQMQSKWHKKKESYKIKEKHEIEREKERKINEISEIPR